MPINTQFVDLAVVSTGVAVAQKGCQISANYLAERQWSNIIILAS